MHEQVGFYLMVTGYIMFSKEILALHYTCVFLFLNFFRDRIRTVTNAYVNAAEGSSGMILA